MADWRNRIVEHAEVDPSELTPHPLNFRRHPQRQADALAGLIESVGWVDDVIVNLTTGHILDGHLRVEAAIKKGEPSVPVKYVQLSEDEENLVLASFDPITGLAEMDNAALAELLGRVDMQAIEDDGLAGLLEELATASGAGGDAGEPVDAEPQIDRAEELREKWGVAPGDLWLLDSGKGHAHRLICGDCTDADVVGRVMDGEKATVIFTDPPYGVSIGAKNRLLNSVQPSGRNLTDVVDDQLSPDDLKAQLLPAFRNMRVMVMGDDCTLFVTAPQGGELCMMMMMMMEAGLPTRHVLIWKKNQPTFSMGRLDYDYQHEPILLTWGKRHKRPMQGAHRTSVWEIDKPRASPDHPTTKPVELVINALLNNSDRGDVAFDAYGGSGTLIMACESTARAGRSIEISPAYVAVALERFAVAVGIDPVRMEGV